MHADRIRRVLAAKALTHPELHAPLTWNALRGVLAREDVALEVRPIAKPARLIGFDGLWGVVVSSRFPARRHTYFAAHELGHLWLHVDDADGRHVRCFNFDDYTSPDPREEEAETVAAWLLGDREVRAFLDVPDAPGAVLMSPPPTSLQAAIFDRQIVRGHEIERPAPLPAPTPPLTRERPTPEYFRSIVTRIVAADGLRELVQLRRVALLTFAKDARRQTLLDEIDARQAEMVRMNEIEQKRRR
jgi:hypothetical protein